MVRPPAAPTTALGRPDTPDTKLDVNSMLDVTSYAGVDLREEEERLIPTSTPYFYTPYPSRTKEQSFLTLPALRSKILRIAKEHNIPIAHVESDLLPYIALATQERMRDFVER